MLFYLKVRAFNHFRVLSRAVPSPAPKPAPRRLPCAGLGLILAALAIASPADNPAPAPDAIIGDWMVASHDAVVRIDKAGTEYQGRLVWLKQSTYGPDDGPALDGKPVTDTENPDEDLRQRPLLGLRMLWGLRYVPGKRTWEGGHVYNSDDGLTYRCRVWVDGPDRLKLHGYVGFSLLGGTTTWTRTEVPPVTQAPAQGH